MVAVGMEVVVEVAVALVATAAEEVGVKVWTVNNYNLFPNILSWMRKARFLVSFPWVPSLGSLP